MSTPPTGPSHHDTYTSPLASRNASPEMLRIWSPRHKFNTWRRIWLAVAEAQHATTKDWDTPLVTQEQIDELRAVVERGITDEELARAGELERELRHDVMAHVHCLGEQCPKAKAIIHLGCTSQDVVCNADLITQFQSLELFDKKLQRTTLSLGNQADLSRCVPALGFTHYQSAQPTTVGRRIAGWAFDLESTISLTLYEGMFETPTLRGFRGATGTQGSFLKLFGGDSSLVDRFEAIAVWKLLQGLGLQSEGDFDSFLEIMNKFSDPFHEMTDALAIASVSNAFGENAGELISSDLEHTKEDRVEMNWSTETFLKMRTFRLTGQTYPRFQDAQLLSTLATVASVLHKIATDIRLLSNRKEIDEPFGKSQIGSSAMPYKRNPMKCERICGLTRFVMNLVGNAYDTAATQWLERTLDDSSNRRLSLPEAFLALDGALDLMHEVASGLVVNEAMVRKNLMDELPFLATENILMEAVKAGGDRQDLHEAIRVHAQAAGQRVKQEGLDNDLLERLKNDPAFKGKDEGGTLDHALNWDNLMDPMQYVGRSVEQTERFVKEVVEPLRERYSEELASLGSSDRGV